MELTSSSLLVGLFVLAEAVSRSQASSDQTDELVVANLPKLPEPFDNDKLSVVLANATRCHELIGCFEPIPINLHIERFLDLDPRNVGTKFLFYANYAPDTVIEFKLARNCLKDDQDRCDLYPFDLQSLSDAPFDPSRRTIIFVSGFLTKPPTDWELGCKELWLQLEDVNIIIVNWSGANSRDYLTAATNTRLISRQITVLLYYLARLNDLELTEGSFTEKIYIVGHSLGAHIAGFVGMDLGGALGRITGLDPAGPSFDQLPERFRLDRSDAQLVDAIHSNGGAIVFSKRPRYGTDLMSGHVDLYANDGSSQPNCINVFDIKGCSHGKSNKYYMAFLQHELSMRNYLKENYTSLYRLNAYIGEKWADFHSGRSLLRHCPKAAHINRDLFSTDLNSCSIPIDYFSWYSHVRDELRANHGIEFHPGSRQNNSFFFLTSPDTDDQTDHYLIKAHIVGLLRSRTASDRETSDDVLPNLCDISFHIKMDGGHMSAFKIEQYQLVEQKDHYDVIAPYLANNIQSKYRIAKLDSQDFNLIGNSSTVISNRDDLRESLLKIFPKSIRLSGVHIDEEAAEKRSKERESPGIIKSIKSIYNYWRGKKEDESVDEEDGKSCKLAVEHLAVRPLRLFHRMIIAYYSVKLDDREPRPKIVLLYDNATEVPKHTFLAHDSLPVESTELQLDTVIIGPYDKSFIHPIEKLDLDGILPTDSNTYMKYISSGISPLTWMILTLLLIAFIIALAAITSLQVKSVDTMDKRALLMSSISTISYPTQDPLA